MYVLLGLVSGILWQVDRPSYKGNSSKFFENFGSG